MKKLLNTLFITSQGAYLSREGETVHVSVNRETKLQVPIHTLSGIVCFGHVNCSPPLMHLCGERNVALSFLSENGRFLARVQGPVSGNVLLRREQYRRADDREASAAFAQIILTAKICNSRAVLMRAARDRPDDPVAAPLQQTAGKLASILRRLGQPAALAELRGIEGDAAREYFSAFDYLITAQKENFFFNSRSRRPPLDNVNALLSFFYTLLAHDISAALEAVGLDPAVGFLHRDRPGRPSLALDLMEEFRPYFADRLALNLINRKQISPGGFTQTETGAVTMDDDTRKQVILAWQQRKQDKIRHPFIDEEISVGLLPHAQALLLARWLRGDLDAYPPYLWK